MSFKIIAACFCLPLYNDVCAGQVCSGQDGYGQHKARGGPLERGAFLQSGGPEEPEQAECRDNTCFDMCPA